MSKTEEAATIPGCGVPAFAAPIARRLNPKLLLLGKCTAAVPHGQETHFMLPRVIRPQPPATRIESIDLETVYSGRVLSLSCCALIDAKQWLQGWSW